MDDHSILHGWLSSAGFPRRAGPPEAARSALRLAGKVVRHPGRALLRLLLRARVAQLDVHRDHARFLEWLADEFGADAAALDAEYHASAFRQSYLARLRKLHASIGPQRLGTADAWCLKALYLLVRAARPRVVVETGVLYGASSAHLLAALAANGEGELYSIDLPHEPGEPPVDCLIPGSLARRWTLLEDDCRRALPALLERLAAIDLFHHDSLHTFEHMTWEYQTALPYLTPRGVLSSHDVLVAHSVREIFRPNAFPVFCERHALRGHTFQTAGSRGPNLRPPTWPTSGQARGMRGTRARGKPGNAKVLSLPHTSRRVYAAERKHLTSRGWSAW